ncbi:MAG: SDR family NAD(P)-dependent oxidoreductase [Alphaproteobacteria bacterium]
MSVARGELFDLTGKTAVVTGATKGIGKAIAEAMAAHGARVVVSSRKQDACDRVAASIRDSGGTAVPVACNISHKDQLETLVAASREAFDKIDILVCNAAVNPYFGPLFDCPDSAFDKIMNANVHANIRLAGMVVPEMAERRDGVVIVISSVGGLRGNPTLGAYGISKAADMQLARNIAVEWGPRNVRANCIAPSLVKTDFARALWENPETYRKSVASYPLGRLGEPHEIAGTAVWLAGKGGAFVTGQTIVVDGGVMIGNPSI